MRRNRETEREKQLGKRQKTEEREQLRETEEIFFLKKPLGKMVEERVL